MVKLLQTLLLDACRVSQLTQDPSVLISLSLSKIVTVVSHMHAFSDQLQ